MPQSKMQVYFITTKLETLKNQRFLIGRSSLATTTIGFWIGTYVCALAVTFITLVDFNCEYKLFEHLCHLASHGLYAFIIMEKIL